MVPWKSLREVVVEVPDEGYFSFEPLAFSPPFLTKQNRSEDDEDDDESFQGGLRRRTLWQAQETSNLDSGGITYKIRSVPELWHYTPLIVADNPKEISTSYGIDPTHAEIAIKLHSFEDIDLNVNCSFVASVMTYAGKKFVSLSFLSLSLSFRPYMPPATIPPLFNIESSFCFVFYAGK